VRWFVTLVLLLVPLGLAAEQAGPRNPLFGVGFDDALTEPAGLAAVLASVPPGSWTHRIHVRLVVRRADLEPTPGRYEFSALDARLDEYRRLPGVDVYLDIRATMPTPELMLGWTRFVRELAGHAGPLARGYLFGADTPAGAPADAVAYAFFLKTTSIELRAVRADAAVILGGVGDADAAWLDALYDHDVAPYLDAIALVADRPSARIAPIVDRRDAGAAIVIAGAPLGDSAATAAERFAARQGAVLGTRVTGVTYAAEPRVVAAALPAVAFLRDLIDQPLETLDDASAGLSLVPAALPPLTVTEAPTHRLIFGLSTAATYFIYSGAPVELTITEATGSRPVIRDPVRLTRVPADTFSHDAARKRATIKISGSTWPLIVDWSAGDASTRVERSDVSSSVLPTVAEIIARNQQAQAAQDAVLHTVIANATMTQHFRASAAQLAFDVATENRFYTEGKQTEFEELSFRVNGLKYGVDRPAFPLLQAEKVLSLPLDLRLTSDYRYTLEGVADVDGRECFVLRFEPIVADQSLYKGTVWIDRQTYLRAKVHTIQTELTVPMLSSEETQHFARVGSVGGLDIWLLVDLVGQQNIMIAGTSLLLERQLSFRDVLLNPEDFDAQRQQARASNRIMYRDTDKGIRYLVLKDGLRVVDDRLTTSAKALLLGVNVDPSYDYPLPLGGLNYLDFQFLGPDSQLAVLFAGVLALVDVQRPHLIGDKVDGNANLFAIAVPSSDRTYDESGERSGERVYTIPFTAGGTLGWRLTDRARLTANYEFRYDKYFAEPEVTAPEFQVPASTATNGVGLGLEWRKAGYAVAAHWTGYARAQWQSWGTGDDYSPSDQQYTRHSLSLTKDIFTGIHKFHLNAAYYGGLRLDRFSQYQFGFFDEHRIHGVPSSGVRFSDLAMFRASYGFNLFDQYRAEISFDQAYGRDPHISSAWQRITGVGVGFLLRGPYQTMIRGDVGKSFLPAHYAKPGSLTFQIQILKPLK